MKFIKTVKTFKVSDLPFMPENQVCILTSTRKEMLDLEYKPSNTVDKDIFGHVVKSTTYLYVKERVDYGEEIPF